MAIATLYEQKGQEEYDRNEEKRSRRASSAQVDE